MKQNVLTVVQETVILGKQVKLYKDIENPLFEASDIANWLGIQNVSQMLKQADVPESEKGIFLKYTLGGNQNSLFVTEDAMYDVLMASRKREAKPFRREIKSYLKQIRKTGGYIPIHNQDDDLTIMARAHQILERTISQKDQIISQLKPKADTYDIIMDTDDTFSMNQVAKQIGMGEYHLFAYLRGKKVLFYEGTDNVPYERFRKNGCFKVIDR